MGRPPVWDPCLAPVEHFPMPGPKRVRVVQILATGTNGGAQEHVFGLMSRLDPTHYDASVVSLSAGSAVRKLQRHGFAVTVIDEPDDDAAIRLLTDHLKVVRPDVIHTHNSTAHLYGAIGGWLARVPVLHTEHGKNIGHEQRYHRLNRIAARFTERPDTARDLQARVAIPRHGVHASATRVASSQSQTRRRTDECPRRAAGA